MPAYLDDYLGEIAPRRQRRRQQSAALPFDLTPEQTTSLIGRAGGGLVSGLSAGANVLDLPGSMVRDVIGGVQTGDWSRHNPFDQIIDPFGSQAEENRVYGRDLLRNAGAIGKKDTWGNFASGLGVDVLTDPLTYMTFGASALGKGGKAAKAAGALPEGLAAQIAGGHRGLAGLRFPFSDAVVPLGTGKVSQKIAGGVDNLYEAARYGDIPGTSFSPGRMTARLFDSALGDTRTKQVQKLAKGLSGKRTAEIAAGRLFSAAKARELIDSGLVTPENGDALRRALEGTGRVGDFDPAKMGDVTKFVDETIAENQQLLQRAQAAGMDVEAFQDSTNLRYFQRYLSAEGSTTKWKGKVLDTTDKSQIGREWYMRDIEGGTDTIQKIARDADIESMFAAKAKPTAIRDAITAKYGDVFKGDAPRLNKIDGAMPASELMAVHPSLANVPKRILEETPISQVIRSTPGASTSSLGDATAFYDRAQRALRVIDDTSPEFADEVANEVIAAWAWNNLKPEQYSQWRRLVGRPASDAVQGGVGGGMSNVDSFAASVIDWMHGNPWGESESLMKDLFQKTATKSPKQHGTRFVESLMGMKPETRAAGVFGNHPVADMMHGMTSRRDAITVSEGINEFLQRPGMTTSAIGPDTVPADELLKSMKLSGSPLVGQGLHVPADIAKDLQRLHQGFTNPDSVNELIKAYDSTTNLWKAGQTGMWPAFHVRNRVSGLWQNYVAGMFDLRSELDAGAIMQRKVVKDAHLIPAVAQEAFRRGYDVAGKVEGPHRVRVAKAAMDAFGPEADQFMPIMDARAITWAGETGQHPDKWFEKIQDIRRGDPSTVGPGAMFQGGKFSDIRQSALKIANSELGGDIPDLIGIEQYAKSIANTSDERILREVEDSFAPSFGFSGNDEGVFVPHGKTRKEFLREYMPHVLQAIKPAKELFSDDQIKALTSALGDSQFGEQFNKSMASIVSDADMVYVNWQEPLLILRENAGANRELESLARRLNVSLDDLGNEMLDTLDTKEISKTLRKIEATGSEKAAYEAKKAADYIDAVDDPLEFAIKKWEKANGNGQPLFQGGVGGKGAVEFANNKAIVTAFQSADISTLAHETAHIFRRDLSPQLLSEAEQALGVQGGQWAVSHEEAFASGFERYLRDGNAPTNALKAVFGKFKEWLTNIYRSIAGTPLQNQVNPQLKGVFDKMLGKGRKQLGPEDGTKILADLAFAHEVIGKWEGEAANVVGKASKPVASTLDDITSGIPGVVPTNRLATTALDIPTFVGARKGTNRKPWRVRGVGDLTSSEFGPAKWGDNLGHVVEGQNRLSPFINQLRKGVDPATAAQKVSAAQVPYGNKHYTPFESQFLARLLPFYKFSSKMLPYQLRMLADQPGGKLAQTLRGINRASDPNEMTPDYVAETASIPLGGRPDGSNRYLTGFGLPVEDTLSLVTPDVRSSGLEVLSRMNPWVKGPLEYMTGQTFFQKGPAGGRPLEDLDPTVGRLMANIKQQLGGEETRFAKPVMGSSALEFVLANSPLSRALTSARTASDPRKGNLGKAMNLLTGFKVTDVSPGSQDALLQERADQAMKTLGARDFEVTYLPEDVKASLSPEQQVAYLQLMAIKKAMQKRKKERVAATSRP